jgi:hypothetical protein
VSVRNGTPISSLVIASNQVFIGGLFTNVNGQTRTNLASLDLVTGAVTDWAPNPSSTIFALGTWKDRLFVGGAFTSISGWSQSFFVEYYLEDLSLTFWNPDIHSLVQSFAVYGDTLYVGGNFTTIGTETRRRVAAFDLNSDSLTAWDAGITNGSVVNAIVPTESCVYLGGLFSIINGSYRSNFVALDATTAQVLPLVANTDTTVYGLAATSNYLFMAGNFLQVNGQNRGSLASLDLNSGTLTTWNPKCDFLARAIKIFDNVLYPAGSFLHAGGETTRSIAAYPLSLIGLPTIVSNSMQRLPNGNAQFRLAALGVPQATVNVSTNLNDWQPLQTVPLTAGNGVFVDSNTANYPRRFYRVSVP